MSINSQILATMEGEGIVDDTGLDGPLNAPGLPGEVNTSISDVQQTPMTDAIKQRLLQPGIAYKSLTDNVETVATMEEVNNAIASKGHISFADAEEVAMTFESFQSRVSLKEFTQVPSRTNYQFTTNFMAGQIKLRKEEVNAQVEVFFNGHTEDAEDAFDMYKECYAVNLRQMIEENAVKIRAWLDDPKARAAQVFQWRQDFINLATIPVSTIPADWIGPGNREKFSQATRGLQSLLEGNLHIKNLLMVVKDTLSVGDFIDPSLTAKSLNLDPTMVDFLEFLVNPHLLTLIGKFEEEAEVAIKGLNDLRRKEGVDLTNFQAVRDFVLANGPRIDQLNEAVHYFTEVIELLQSTVTYITAAFEYFQMET